jgi:hypothetical protein
MTPEAPQPLHVPLAKKLRGCDEVTEREVRMLELTVSGTRPISL